MSFVIIKLSARSFELIPTPMVMISFLIESEIPKLFRALLSLDLTSILDQRQESVFITP